MKLKDILLAMLLFTCLGFTSCDDLLDVEGDEAAAGKTLRKDDGAGKATFVSLMGADAALA